MSRSFHVGNIYKTQEIGKKQTKCKEYTTETDFLAKQKISRCYVSTIEYEIYNFKF